MVNSSAGGPGWVVIDFGGLVKGADFYKLPVLIQNGAVSKPGTSGGGGVRLVRLLPRKCVELCVRNQQPPYAPDRVLTATDR